MTLPINLRKCQKIDHFRNVPRTVVCKANKKKLEVVHLSRILYQKLAVIPNGLQRDRILRVGGEPLGLSENVF